MAEFSEGLGSGAPQDAGCPGGAALPVGLGCRIPPAARVRVHPHYPDLPALGPRRDVRRVWDWVWDSGNISRILENDGDFNF